MEVYLLKNENRDLKKFKERLNAALYKAEKGYVEWKLRPPFIKICDFTLSK